MARAAAAKATDTTARTVCTSLKAVPWPGARSLQMFHIRVTQT
jgi:hypothetical protein